MDLIVKLERIHDHKLIHKTVMTMIDDIIEDDTSHDCFVIDTEKECWLMCTDNGEFVGLFQLTPFNRTVLDMHCYILKGARNKSSLYAKKSLEWFRDESPEMYKRVITSTPYVHIKKWLIKLGFEIEGCHKRSFTKNDERLDLYLFGIERGSI